MAETAEPITMVKDGVEVVATDTGIVSALQNQGFDYKAEPVVEEEPEVKKTTRPRRKQPEMPIEGQEYQPSADDLAFIQALQDMGYSDEKIQQALAMDRMGKSLLDKAKKAIRRKKLTKKEEK